MEGQTQAVSGMALHGHLHLRAECRENGQPYLARQSFRAPIHLSKTHIEQDHLLVHLVNPTAGFFDGDRLDLDASAGPGVKMILSTPGASRVFQSRKGLTAHCFQNIRVEPGAFVEWISEPFIPQAGARYHQHTRIDLASDAALLFFDWITPGRVARGEIFAYQQLRWELDLFREESLIARERFTLQPENDSLHALQVRYPAAHYLSVYAAGIPAEDWPAEALDVLNTESVYLGHGPLGAGVHIVRLVCEDSLHARAMLTRVRELLYQARRLSAPRLGKILA